MDLIAEIRKVDDPALLERILEETRSRRQSLTRALFQQGDYCQVELNSRKAGAYGMQDAYITKAPAGQRQKIFNLILVGADISARQWRVAPGMLKPMPQSRLESAKQKKAE